VTLPDTNNLPFPMFIANADGVITYVNATWRRTFGDAQDQPWVNRFHDLNMADLNAQWHNHREGERPLKLRSRCVDSAGLQRIFDIHCHPVLESENDPARIFATLVEVTDEVQSQAETLAILETAVDAIILMDESGRIDAFNKAASRMFGYAPEEVLGKPVTMLMPEPHRSKHEAYVARYLATGEKKIIGVGRELEFLTKSGKRTPCYLAVSEIDQGSRRRFTGIIRDLSEQQAAREALTDLRERLAHVGRLSTMGEMTASIAHEINQPLTAISIYAQSSLKLLDRGDADPGKLRNALEKLNTQSLRAGAIIERIQRFARAQESQRELAQVSTLLTDLLKLAESDARLHDMQIQLDLADDLPLVLCDPIQVQQVALNLIRNAIDAMNEIHCANGRAIVIRTEAVETDTIKVSVSDQGPGVAQNQTDLLFTPFHTTKKEGMGMGLSICRSIIAGHGGELSFTNNKDVGATFYFTLPVGAHGDE